jgi:spore germination protein
VGHHSAPTTATAEHAHLHLVSSALVADHEDDDLPQVVEDERPNRPRKKKRRWLLLVAALVAAATAVVATRGLPWGGGAGAGNDLKLTATLPYWNLTAGSGKVVANKSDFTGASPWMFGLQPDGSVVSSIPSASQRDADEAVSELRDAGVPIIPTIANTRNGSWDYPTVNHILNDATARQTNINSIVDLAVGQDFAGIDVDYENLLAGDRTAFTSFVADLAKALHAKKKTLSVELFAKTNDRGYDQRNVAQDYAAIGKIADQVRIMAYDWHWSTSEPGPIAPIDWVRDVLQYALTQIPAKKIILGVPEYGYDWVGNKGQLISWLQAYGIEQRYGAAVQWDNNAQSPWLTYRSADGQKHIVWFENGYSSSAKLGLARSMGIGGAYLWMAGDEDDLLWSRLSAKAIQSAAATATQSAGQVTPR